MSARPNRVAWKPKLSVIGIAGGVLGAVGCVVFLQQAGSVFPTQNVVNGAFFGGLLAGVVLPSLGRAVAVGRINRALARREAGAAATWPATVPDEIQEVQDVPAVDEAVPAVGEAVPTLDEVVPVEIASGNGDGLGWRATHVVGEHGADGWQEPDPALPATPLDPNLEVEVLEERGDWAHIRCANGWLAWVDGRRLVALGG